jgi:hypothetical protein
MPRIGRERGRFASLLIAQLFFIFISPFIEDHGTGKVFLKLAVWGIFIAGAYAAAAQRTYFRFALLLLIPALAAWVLPDIFSAEVNETLRMLTAALCFSFSAFVVVRSAMEHEEVTLDTILAGINTYLLMAFAFVFLYASLLIWNHDAFLIQGTSLYERLYESPDSYGFATFLYFSFTTLTTLGYGDIVPNTSLARLVTSSQAVMGQLYIAIFIGRLVGLEVARHRRPS